ncbi:AEC family transporter [Halomonas cupida]|uniref:AEC family transporter n=1 Tax=Halomonas cupida TaxID=44933 RepID=UPI003A93C7AF
MLKRLGWIDQTFVNTASSLVFKATMPTLLFLSILQSEPGSALNLGLVLWYLTISAALFGLIWLWALWRCPRQERGVYVQGAFRGNCGIVGLALAANMYGDLGLSLGGIMAGGHHHRESGFVGHRTVGLQPGGQFTTAGYRPRCRHQSPDHRHRLRPAACLARHPVARLATDFR